MKGTFTGSRGRLWRRLAIVLSLLFAAYFGIGAYVFVATTRPRRYINAAVTPASQGLVYKDVVFPARGGDVTLNGWFISATSRRAIVLVHGKDSSRAGLFGRHGPEVAASLHRHDFSVLFFDLRGHGTSGDARLTLGLNEARDVLGAVDWLRGHDYPAGSIGVLGQSMGGAATIYAAAAEPAIGAVITDCAFADARPVVDAQFRQTAHLPNVFLPATRLISRALLGLDIVSSRPVGVISRIAPRPVLIIHGDADRLVPVSQAFDFKAALPSAELWILPGVQHVGGYRKDPAGFTQRVEEFFSRSLPRP